MWGTVDGTSFSSAIYSAYYEAVHWRHNLFTVPWGKAGTSFVTEIASLFRAYGESSALESISLCAAMVAPILLLQKPHARSKTKDHIKCLERHLAVWKAGDIEALLDEGRTIQGRFRPPPTKSIANEEKMTQQFVKFMRQGKVKAALRLLDSQKKGGVLLLNDTIQSNSRQQTVREVLLEKHPAGQPVHPDTLLQSYTTASDVHPVLFDRIYGELIRHFALRTEGSAGPSGVDSHGWRRMCTSFKKASLELYSSVAMVARRICSTLVDPVGLSPLIACRLIALDKCPGVRPIGIGKTVRRIIGKAISHIIRDDLQEAAGSSQLCAGQESGSEAAVHAIHKIFKEEETEAVLEVDATNAFNRLNRQSTLQNIRVLCPSLATALINTYRNNAELFIDGESVLSREGTTQGDPLAMGMYALGILPLIRKLDHLAKQVWFADDTTAGGKLKQLCEWWDEIVSVGPSYGYFANPKKTWLIVKPDHLQSAQEMFRDTGVSITSEGRRHLGAAIGRRSFVEDYMNEKVNNWVGEVTKLASIATTHPQEAYAALTHGLTSKWTYFMRTIPNIANLLQPLEDTIRYRLIPAITGKSAISDLERDLFSLPTRLGGLNIPNTTTISSKEYDASMKVTAALVEAICQQTGQHDYSTPLF